MENILDEHSEFINKMFNACLDSKEDLNSAMMEGNIDVLKSFSKKMFEASELDPLYENAFNSQMELMVKQFENIYTNNYTIGNEVLTEDTLLKAAELGLSGDADKMELSSKMYMNNILGSQSEIDKLKSEMEDFRGVNIKG